MAKSIPWLIAGVCVGIVVFMGVQRYNERQGANDQNSGQEAPPPSLAGAGSTGEGAGAATRREGSTGGALPGRPAVGELAGGPGGLPVLRPADSIATGRPVNSAGAGSGGTTPGVYKPPAVGQNEFAILAERIDTALAAGRKQQAITWLRALIQKGEGRTDVDLTSQAMRLLELDEDPRSRRQSLGYLQARGAGSVAFQDQLSRASTMARAADSSARKKAWEELSVAYDVARNDSERQQVLGVLDPYIQEMVFSKRFTPLLQEHPVQVGDTLLKIAVRYGTTVDAIMRLNGLTAETIQPRTRLRILSGKPRIYVKKSEYRLWLTIDDKIFFERRVGLGRDNATPIGNFAIRVKQKDPTWYPPGGGTIPAGDPRNILGTRWLGFKDTDRYVGFGIHGTDKTSDLGVESSSGCVRLVTEEMELLYDFIPRGTPVSILE